MVKGSGSSIPNVVGLRLLSSLVSLCSPLRVTQQLKMVYSDYVKQRIPFYWRLGKCFTSKLRTAWLKKGTQQ